MAGGNFCGRPRIYFAQDGAASAHNRGSKVDTNKYWKLSEQLDTLQAAATAAEFDGKYDAVVAIWEAMDRIRAELKAMR